MDLIKLLDVSSPKNIKNVINTLIKEYENVAENFPTKLSDLTDDETHRLVTDTEKASWDAKLSAIPNDYKTKTENDNLYQPKGNYLTSFTETDPTVPAWAKAATKPSYNYSEINNTPTIPTVNNSTITIKQGEETKGTFTLNQTEDKTIELDVGGGGGSNVILYEGLGQNTDGAVTQKVVTNNFNLLSAVFTDTSNSSSQLTIDAPEFVLKEGAEILVKSVRNPYDWVLANINNTGDYKVYFPITATTVYEAGVSQWAAGDIIKLKYVTGLKYHGSNYTVNGYIITDNYTKNISYIKGTTLYPLTITTGSGQTAWDGSYPVSIEAASLDDVSFNLPMGAIFKSATPQTSKAFHLLDGSVLDATVDASYQTFINYINAVAAEYNIAVTDEEYETILATYGQCGKFVVTSTSVRLPIVTKHTEGLTDLTNIGEAIKAALPAHTHTGSYRFRDAGSSGGPYNGVGSGSYFNWNTQTLTTTTTTDEYGIYGNSDTVQTDSIKYPYYIVISTKEEVLNINTLTNEWEISSTSTEMYFKNNGVAVLTISSSGNVIVPDITIT